MFGALPARKQGAATRKVETTAAPAPAAQPGETQEESSPFDVAVDSIQLMGSAVSYTDLSGLAPANVALDGLNVWVKNLRLNG